MAPLPSFPGVMVWVGPFRLANIIIIDGINFYWPDPPDLLDNGWLYYSLLHSKRPYGT